MKENNIGSKVGSNYTLCNSKLHYIIFSKKKKKKLRYIS